MPFLQLGVAHHCQRTGQEQAPLSGIHDCGIEEIRTAGQRLHARAIRPKLIYFGGTPSLLPSADLVAILQQLHAQFPGAAATMDATLEISPDTLTLERALILRQSGSIV